MAIAQVKLVAARVIYVGAGDDETVLSCMEEKLRHGGLGAVIDELAQLAKTASRTSAGGGRQATTRRRLLPGLAKVHKTLADGTRRTYWYAWRGGPLLCDAQRRPLTPIEPAFSVAYHDAHKTLKPTPEGTMAGLVALYRSSAEFAKIAPKTKKGYEPYLAKIEARFGTMPLAAIVDPAARRLQGVAR